MEEINKRIYYLHSQIDLLLKWSTTLNDEQKMRADNFSKIYGSSTLSWFNISMAKNCQNGRDQARKTCSW